MKKPTFRVFLSHRYKSPDANQRFFDVLTAHGNVRFEVDVGVKATNVTRLERFVRDADGFVGIYPFPSEADDRPKLETALDASRYFRLELDLALRSRRPAIIFLDARYGTAITIPRTARVFRYDPREVFGTASDRRDAQLAQLAREFCDDVAAAMRLGAARQEEPSSQDCVGILVPSNTRRAGYTKQHVATMEDRLAQLSLRVVHLDSKAAIDGRFMSELATLDWAVVDIGAEACASGLPAFLHGHFVPQMRLIRVSGKQTRSPLESSLLAAFDVGYPKDIIRWSDGETLDREFTQRLTTLYEPRKYVRDSAEARTYFASAALRKEAVFLSYSGEDREPVAEFARALRRRFQQVFDYRDQGESIMPGRLWIKEVFDKLAASAIGVIVLSPTYLASGNCIHEASELIAQADAGKLELFPVKLKDGPLDLPTWMKNRQYARASDYSTPEQLVDKMVSTYETAERATAPPQRPT